MKTHDVTWERVLQYTLSGSLTEFLQYSGGSLLVEGLEDVVLEAVQLGPHLGSHLCQGQWLRGVEQAAEECAPQAPMLGPAVGDIATRKEKLDTKLSLSPMLLLF